MRIAIKWEEFQRVIPFQSEYFIPTLGASASDPTLHFLTGFLAQSIPQNATFKVPTAQARNVNFYFQGEESGSILSYIEYECDTADGTSRTYAAVIAADLCIYTVNNKKVSTIPYYLLAGEKTAIDGQAVFSPEIISYRAVPDGLNSEPLMIEADAADEDHFSEALCYADECIRRLSAELPLDIAAAQSWTDVSDDDLDKRVAYLTSRTAHQFALEVQQLQRLVALQGVQDFHMPAPKAFQ